MDNAGRGSLSDRGRNVTPPPFTGANPRVTAPEPIRGGLSNSVAQAEAELNRLNNAIFGGSADAAASSAAVSNAAKATNAGVAPSAGRAAPTPTVKASDILAAGGSGSFRCAGPNGSGSGRAAPHERFSHPGAQSASAPVVGEPAAPPPPPSAAQMDYVAAQGGDDLNEKLERWKRLADETYAGMNPCGALKVTVLAARGLPAAEPTWVAHCAGQSLASGPARSYYIVPNVPGGPAGTLAWSELGFRSLSGVRHPLAP